MYLGSVPIDSGSGLGAEVTVSVVEIERTNAVLAPDTIELYSPFDPIDRVMTHGSILVLCSEGRTAPRLAVEGNLRNPLRTLLVTLVEIPFARFHDMASGRSSTLPMTRCHAFGPNVEPTTPEKPTVAMNHPSAVSRVRS